MQRESDGRTTFPYLFYFITILIIKAMHPHRLCLKTHSASITRSASAALSRLKVPQTIDTAARGPL